jgi:hypothetical protein
MHSWKKAGGPLRAGNLRKTPLGAAGQPGIALHPLAVSLSLGSGKAGDIALGTGQLAVLLFLIIGNQCHI